MCWLTSVIDLVRTFRTMWEKNNVFVFLCTKFTSRHLLDNFFLRHQCPNYLDFFINGNNVPLVVRKYDFVSSPMEYTVADM